MIISQVMRTVAIFVWILLGLHLIAVDRIAATCTLISGTLFMAALIYDEASS